LAELQVKMLNQHCSLLCVLLIHLPQQPLGSVNDLKKKVASLYHLLWLFPYCAVFVGYFSVLVWINYIMLCQWFRGICIVERQNMVMSDEWNMLSVTPWHKRICISNIGFGCSEHKYGLNFIHWNNYTLI
jgi:hypothetical protein